MKALLVVLSALLALAPVAGQERTDPWSDDFFAQAIVGSWTGTGVVYGNDVELTRTWERDLADHFLRADMHVGMSGGGFRALGYWRRVGDLRYEITWMDEMGESQTFHAVGDPSTKQVSTYYVEDGDEGAEWRRLVYRIVGDNAYEELMFRESADGWAQLAEFKFRRDAN